MCSRKNLTENVGKYFPPNIDDSNFKKSAITDKNFDETWTSVINFVNDSFKIENIEKDSGSLTLSFGSKNLKILLIVVNLNILFYWRNLKVRTLIMLKVAY